MHDLQRANAQDDTATTRPNCSWRVVEWTWCMFTWSSNALYMNCKIKKNKKKILKFL